MTKVPCRETEDDSTGCSGTTDHQRPRAFTDGHAYYRGYVRINGKKVFCDTLNCPIYDPIECNIPDLEIMVRETIASLEGDGA